MERRLIGHLDQDVEGETLNDLESGYNKYKCQNRIDEPSPQDAVCSEERTRRSRVIKDHDMGRFVA